MDEDESTPAADVDEGQAPSLRVPTHDPLPPPPEINYTRPALGRPQTSAQSSAPFGPRDSRDTPGMPEAASHGAGLAAGAVFVTSIIAGAVFGNWIDQRWNHTGMPWATLIMTLLGAAAGFMNLQRLLARTNRNRNQK